MTFNRCKSRYFKKIWKCASLKSHHTTYRSTNRLKIPVADTTYKTENDLKKALGCCKRFVNFLSSQNRLDTLKRKVLTAAMIITQSKQLTRKEEQEIFIRVEIKTRIVTALRIIFWRHAILGIKINSWTVNKMLEILFKIKKYCTNLNSAGLIMSIIDERASLCNSATKLGMWIQNAPETDIGCLGGPFLPPGVGRENQYIVFQVVPFDKL